MSSPTKIDDDALPRVFCQPDNQKSCGACCGMYNHREHSAQATFARLLRRSRAYRARCTIDDIASLQAFRAEFEDPPNSKLLGDLPSCPFLGYLDDELPDSPEQAGRVGCMVHPLQNDGVDGRDCGVYDRFICEDYLCAAHQLLRQHEARLVLQACADSYVYGLVITDVSFVRALFAQTATLNGMSPPRAMLRTEPALQAARDYFELKRDWPFAAADGVFGQLQAGDGLETPRRTPLAEQLGVEPAPEDKILRCLGSQIESLEQLQRARALVRERLQAFADAVAL